MDPWLDGLWKAIKEALSKMNSDRSDHMKGEAEHSLKEAADSCSPDVQLNLLSITDQQDGKLVSQSKGTVPTSAAPSSIAQSAVSDLRAVSPTRRSESASLSSDAASAPTSGQTETQKGNAELSHVTPVASLTYSLPPLSESSLNVPALPSPYLDVSLQQVETTEQVNSWVTKSVCATF